MFCDSTFGTLLKALPRDDIQKIVTKHDTDRWRKSFTTWDHLVAMLAAQFSGVMSLRELEVLLENHPQHHYHLGFKGAKRSTLSDANKSRNSSVFRDIAQMMITRTDRSKGEMKQILSILDSSPISLLGRGHEWAKASKTRSNSQGLKLHVQMNFSNGLLDYAEVTSSNINDITQAQEMPLDKNRIYVFDKGYCDYNWWHEILETGSHFVTRLKKNAAYKVVETHRIESADQDFILQDQTIELSNKHPRSQKTNRLAGHPLRLIQIKHPTSKTRPFFIVSNKLDVSADQIAGWYKKRWSIELLFKWVKQNLKIKRFVGQSRNAIMIQIFVALIAYILLKTYKNMLGPEGQSRLKDILINLRFKLFTRPEMHKRRQKWRVDHSENQHELWISPQ